MMDIFKSKNYFKFKQFFNHYWYEGYEAIESTKKYYYLMFQEIKIYNDQLTDNEIHRFIVNDNSFLPRMSFYVVRTNINFNF